MRRDCLVAVGVVLLSVSVTLANVAVAGTEEDVAAINKLREMEAMSVNEATADHVAMIYAGDVEYIPPGEPALKGTDAVEQWMMGLVDQFEVSLEYTDSKLTLLGDSAVEQYAAVVNMSPKAGGEAMVEHVRGIHVYRRGDDGSWKITHDIWNSAAPHEPGE